MIQIGYSELFLLSINNMVELVCFFMLYDTYFARRRFLHRKKLAMFSLYSAGFFAMTFFNLFGIGMWNTISTFSITIFIMVFAYEVRFSKGILYYILTVTSFIVSEFLTAAIVKCAVTFSKIDYSVSFSSPLLSLASALFKFLLVRLICHFGRWGRDRLVSKSFWFFVLVPISSCLMFIMLGIFDPYYSLRPSAQGLLIASEFAILLGNILIFFAFEEYTKKSRAQYELFELGLKAESEKDILAVAAKSMQRRLTDTEEILERDRVMRHDRRHFEGLLLSLLEDGNADEAKKLLADRLKAEPKRTVKWCSNKVVNATLEYYAQKAASNDIRVTAELNIPEDVSVDNVELAIAVGNLFENAINGCLAVPVAKRYITLKAQNNKQLLFEIENSCEAGIELDEEGYPFTKENGHGIGTKSVLAFATKSGTEVDYRVTDATFRVRMMLPIKQRGTE